MKRRIITTNQYNIVDLKYDKAKPRIHRFDYLKHKYAIYLYLDPFVPGYYKYEFECCGKKQKLETGYLPVYVGKLETPLQYRMNHHINNFMRNIEDTKNEYKKQFFNNLQHNIELNLHSGNPDPMMPKSLDEYKNHWIVIIKTFDDKKQLAEYERNLIKAIGTQYDNSGPLVNKKKGN